MLSDILLIEPDRRLGKIYKMALEETGYRVRHMSTAESALRALDENLPALIVMEPQLVKHGGIEFLYELRSYRDWQDVPVIINSLIPLAILNRMQDSLDQLGVIKQFYKPQTSLGQLIEACQQIRASSISIK